MMTLDEAIKHATEVSETCNNKECGLDHKQLADWLTELKSLREQHIDDVMEIMSTKYAEQNTNSVQYRYSNPDVRIQYNINKTAYIAGFKQGLKYNI